MVRVRRRPGNQATNSKPPLPPSPPERGPTSNASSGTGDLFLISSGCVLGSRQLVSGQWLQLQPLPPVTIRQINNSAPWRAGGGEREL